MQPIPDAFRKVPMMFRAQIDGRCQLHHPVRDQEPDSVLWAYEWVDKAYPTPPTFDDEAVQTKTFRFTWRFVTNSGQDDGVIRPVIGAKGYPFYPGSSMKGVFRRACTPDQAERYCGKRLSGGDFEPGMLRFHGGYPTDKRWTENLVDIVHPQQDWQVKSSRKEGGAFVQISLYKPELQFGISSSVPLEASEWEQIWEIWNRAIASGLGCRVSAGYGQPIVKRTDDILHRAQIKGQGQAPKLIDGTPEFRPNILRAGIRGHALRLFGGLTDTTTAESCVEQLFGGVQGKGTAGLLNMAFRELSLELDEDEPATYEVEGELFWLLSRAVSTEEQEALKDLITGLSRFAMLLGGFGKSWRRADHRLFLEDYEDHLIGCHWQWAGVRSLVVDNKVRKLSEVAGLINDTQSKVGAWLALKGHTVHPDQYAIAWREAWHPDKVQVWGRKASNREDSLAIEWLHREYSASYQGSRRIPLSIKGSSLTGKLNQIGRLWHRMYPVVLRQPNPKNAKRAIPKVTSSYLELLTLFPDKHDPETQDFLRFLQSEQDDFEKLW
ncbi:RAMP superfamily protein [Thermoleptolyngbya sp.]